MKVIITNGYWQEQSFEKITSIEYEYQPHNGDSMWIIINTEDGETLHLSFDPYMDKFEIYK